MAEKVTTGIDITQEELMFEAAQLLKPPTREPGEMTSAYLSEKAGLTLKVALNALITLEEQGLLTMRKIIDGGHITNGYKPVGENGWVEIITLLKKRGR